MRSFLLAVIAFATFAFAAPMSSNALAARGDVDDAVVYPDWQRSDDDSVTYPDAGVDLDAGVVYPDEYSDD